MSHAPGCGCAEGARLETEQRVLVLEEQIAAERAGVMALRVECGVREDETFPDFVRRLAAEVPRPDPLPDLRCVCGACETLRDYQRRGVANAWKRRDVAIAEAVRAEREATVRDCADYVQRFADDEASESHRIRGPETAWALVQQHEHAFRVLTQVAAHLLHADNSPRHARGTQVPPTGREGEPTPSGEQAGEVAGDHVTGRESPSDQASTSPASAPDEPCGCEESARLRERVAELEALRVEAESVLTSAQAQGRQAWSETSGPGRLLARVRRMAP